MKGIFCLLRGSCLLALLFSLGISASELQGYGKTKWGMTVEQVKASEADRVQEVTQQMTYRNALGLLQIKELLIGADAFNAVYQFSADKRILTGVLLTALGDESPAKHKRIFESVEELLIAKYGEPTYRKAGAKLSWVVGSTSIQLNHTYIPQTMSKVTIIYKPSDATVTAAQNL